MAETEYDLGPAELEVLKVLWDAGPSTVRDVLNISHERGRDVAYTTVQTMLTRLEQKGFVKCNKSDLAFVYRAGITRERISRSRLKTLVSQLYDGAAGQLALQLLKTQRLKPEEIQELHSLIERLDADKQ
jgi:predicted transcriptional regulator